MPTPKRDKTTQELADLLDIDKATLSRWTKRGCPHDVGKTKSDPTKFNEAEVAAWMQANNLTGNVGKPVEAGSDELKALRIRKETALVAKYERENAIADGLLIDAAAEQARDVAKITTLRNRLSGLGGSLSPPLVGLDGAEIQTRLDTEIETILKEFGSK